MSYPGFRFRSVLLVKRMSAGLVVLDVDDGGGRGSSRATWSLVRGRKQTTCAINGDPLPKGGDRWAPIGNQMYRGARISQRAMEGLCTLYVPVDSPSAWACPLCGHAPADVIDEVLHPKMDAAGLVAHVAAEHAPWRVLLTPAGA